jgi:hypothetical protein
MSAHKLPVCSGRIMPVSASFLLCAFLQENPMSSRSSPFRFPLFAATLVSLALLHAAPAAAQKAAPAATILDTCQNEDTGTWRYFGVAAVSTADPAASVAVDYWVQNKVTRDGYTNTFKATPGAALRSGDVQIVPFSVDATPLTLGTVRGEATLTVSGATAMAQSTELVGTTCGCTPKGCVRTQGYWGNKPGVVWPGDWYRGMNFYGSGMTWQQLFDTPPRGNAYIILAVQFMSEVLNRNAGASAPQGVQDVVAAARDWFASGTSLQTCAVKGSCEQQKLWAAVLDVYNNGNYPGAPPHCPD